MKNALVKITSNSWIKRLSIVAFGLGGILSTPLSAGTESLKVGMNLYTMDTWYTGRAFCDLAVNKRNFDSSSFNLVNGYPNEVKQGNPAYTVMADGTYNYPSGNYLLSFKGIGSIQIAGIQVSNSDSTKTKTALVYVNTPPAGQKWGGLELNILSSQNGNPVRDIRLMLPGFHNGECDATYPYDPEFINDIKDKGGKGLSTIRFMDWTSTNGNFSRKWSERKTPDYATQSGRVALEYQIKLCNLARVNGWFHIPIQAAVKSDVMTDSYYDANDDYITNMAKMIHDQLDPSLKAYIELGNETWNFSFKAVNKTFPLVCAENDYPCWWPYLAKRHTAAMKMFNEVFKDNPDRIVRVLAGQQNGARDSRYGPYTLLYKEITNITSPSDRIIDAVSPSGYVGPYAPDVERSVSRDQIYNDMMAEVDNELRPNLQSWKRIADSETSRTGRKVEVILYEAGHHLYADKNKAPNLAKSEQDFVANDPRMENIYKYMFQAYVDEGVSETIEYADYKDDEDYGLFGHKHYRGEPDSEAPASYTAMVNQIAIGNSTKATSVKCDQNSDGITDFGDISIIIQAYMQRSPDLDLNGDGVVDGSDINLYIGNCF